MAEGQQKLVIDALAQLTTEQQSTVVDIAKKALDGKEAVSFTVKNEVSAPLRQESPPRAHVFHSVGGFCEYLRKYKTENTVVFIDIDNQRMQAVIDEKAAAGFEIVAFDPQMHPQFEPWDNILSETIPLVKFAEFLRENRRVVTEPKSAELVMLFSQVKVSKKITLHSGIGKNKINGLVCEQDIRGQVENKELDMPEEMKIQCPIYVSTIPADITIDIVVDTISTPTGEVIVARCTSPDLLEKKIEIFDELADFIKEVEGIVISHGKPEYAQWQYVPETR